MEYKSILNACKGKSLSVFTGRLRSEVVDTKDHILRRNGQNLTIKIQNISRAWWHMPVIPATQEAEAGESLESGKCVELFEKR